VDEHLTAGFLSSSIDLSLSFLVKIAWAAAIATCQPFLIVALAVS
jgi:hypothetical protein